MLKQSLRAFSWVLLLGWPTGQAMAQALTLRQAVQTALNNYGTIRAKADYVKAARANVREVKNEYLPDLNLAAEQVYGTANANYGPAIGYKAPAVSSSGPVLPTQNWNAAFGSLYWTNINWDFFQFGRYKQKAQVAQKGLDLNQSDLDQEKFEQSVRVAGAFLNLIAAQKADPFAAGQPGPGGFLSDGGDCAGEVGFESGCGFFAGQCGGLQCADRADKCDRGRAGICQRTGAADAGAAAGFQ